MQKKIKKIILKFGGSSISAPDKFLQIAKIIALRKKSYQQVVVVVSAMGETTNELIKLAKKITKDPPKRELDMLISVGERISISLLAMALWERGIEAISFTGSQSGIITCEEHAEAKIIDVRPWRIVKELNREKVVIVAGFQGISRKKEITTLGRGGSDTSAVALAIALKAEKVEFYKDVDGVYSEDPKCKPEAIFYPFLSYEKALEVVMRGEILHPRCIYLAKKNHIFLEVMSYKNANRKTIIGEKKERTQPVFEEVSC